MSILALKGALSEEKQKRMDLTLRIDANVKAAKELLSASAITPAAEIDLRGASIHIKDALALQDGLKEVLAKIKTIERELNG